MNRRHTVAVSDWWLTLSANPGQALVDWLRPRGIHPNTPGLIYWRDKIRRLNYYSVPQNLDPRRALPPAR